MAARSLLWPDPRVKPPPGIVAIDWTHPLAHGLRRMWLFNEGSGNAVDLVVGQIAQPSIYGGAWWTSEGPGIVAHTSSIDFNSYFDVGGEGSAQVVPFGSAGTIASRGRTSSASWAYLFDAQTSTKRNLLLKEDGSDRYYWYMNDVVIFGPGEGSDDLIVKDGPWAAVALTWNQSLGSNKQTTYKDGALKANHNTTVTIVDTSLTFGSAYVRSYMWDGSIEYWYLYDRKLDAQAVLWLAVEPYAMLEPVVRRRYFVPAAGGAAVRYPQLERGIRGLERGLTTGMRNN